MTVGLSLVSVETIQILFERGSFTAESTALTASALNYHIVGLLFISLTRIYLPCYYAFKDTWTPLWSALISMLVNIGCCYALAPSMGAPGIALANSISAVAQLVVLRALLTKHVSLGFDRVTLRSAGLSTLCAVLAGLGVWGFQENFADALRDGSVELLLSYGLMVLIGAGVFLGAAVVSKHPELAQLKELLPSASKNLKFWIDGKAQRWRK